MIVVEWLKHRTPMAVDRYHASLRQIYSVAFSGEVCKNGE